MKILTVCIVCNDKNDDISKILESCLLLKEDIEVFVLGEENNIKVRSYVDEYPEDIMFFSTTKQSLSTVITQAEGLYFKLLNSKDLLDTPILVKVVETCKDLLRIQANLDMMVCDYQYLGKKAKKGIVSYHNVFPLDKVFQWHQTKGFKTGQKITMEAVIIKSDLLKNIDTMIGQPYSNESILLQVLQSIKSMYYLDQSLVYIPVHHQKLHRGSILEYHDMLMNVIDTMNISAIESRKLRNYITNHINSLLLFFFMYCMKENTIEADICKEGLLEHMIIENPLLYRAIKKTAIFKVYTSDIKVSKAFIHYKYKNTK